ncbi:hypothetical protein VTP01DRAFT_8573 [Rhizomucor pusillus]|uniref:uncharacterized protein n=1 Tax=Rhizomucor pusillus TaxID=4840 RepID=UPI003743F771
MFATDMYNQRSRLNDLLDAVRAEYEQLAQEAGLVKSQRDECELAMNSQIQEISLFQQTFHELERSQMMLKKQYEDEIARLRQQIDQIQHGAPLPPHPLSAADQPSHVKYETVNAKFQHAGYTPSAPHAVPPGSLPPPVSASGHPYATREASLPPNSTASSIGRSPSSFGPPPPGTPSQPAGYGEMDPENVPAAMKVDGHDWFALFNPKVPRRLKIDLLHTFELPSVVCCVKFSADGQYLAAGGNKVTFIFAMSTGDRVAVLQDSSADGEGDRYIRSVSFSPDGVYLATGAEDKLIRIWDIAKGKVTRVLRGHEQDIYSLEFSHNGRLLVSGSGDRSVRIWDWAQQVPIHVLRIRDPEPKDPGITSVAISPDDRLVAAGSLDTMVRVWDLQTAQEVAKLRGHKDSVYSVTFTPDAQKLVSGSLDKALRIWDISSKGYGERNLCIHTLTGHKDFVLSVATTPDNKWIISGSKDRGVQFWDMKTGQTQLILQGHKNSVISVAASPGRRPLFATGSGDSRARIWTYEHL